MLNLLKKLYVESFYYKQWNLMSCFPILESDPTKCINQMCDSWPMEKQYSNLNKTLTLIVTELSTTAKDYSFTTLHSSRMYAQLRLLAQTYLMSVS